MNAMQRCGVHAGVRCHGVCARWGVAGAGPPGRWLGVDPSLDLSVPLGRLLIIGATQGVVCAQGGAMHQCGVPEVAAPSAGLRRHASC